MDISEQIEQYRGYLRLLAEAQTGVPLRGKIDLSGVVQQSLWEAWRMVESAGITEPDGLPKLLRTVLANNLRDEIRRATAQRRDVRLVRSIEASSIRLGGLLANQDASPSKLAIRNERAVLVANAVLQLSETYREVIMRHYLSDESLQETADAMSRTVPSVAGLLRRALKQLRQLVAEIELGEKS
ncbi:MAG: sigma factor-like helix-turn-helix DNA-binding protein [Planctomycetota bacterium]